MRGRDLTMREVGIWRCAGWKFDAALGFGTVQRVRHRRLPKNFFKLTVAFCEFLLSLTNYEAEFF